MLFIFLVIGLKALSQPLPDSLKGAENKRVVQWRFFLGLDASRAGMWLAGSPQQISCGRFEFGRDKLSFSLEAGVGRHQKSFDRYDASSTGGYGRLGFSKLLIRYSDAELGFGVGLGTSSFSYSASRISLPGSDTLPTSQDRNFQATGRSVFWTDFSGMVKTRVWRSVWLGFELRLKFLVKGDSAPIPAYFAPGYGIVQNRFLPGFNYFIFVAIPGKSKNVVSKTH